MEAIKVMSGNTVSTSVFDLEAINATYEKVKHKKKRARIDRRKLKAISCISSLVLIFIGIFTHVVYLYIIEKNDDAEISDRARTYIAPTMPPLASEPQIITDIVTEVVPDLNEPAPEAAPRPVMETVLRLREEFENEDIIGYIQVPGTAIDYMVLQSYDNEYYLNRDVFHRTTVAGSIFLDYANNAADIGSNRNTIIYGHNMRDGTKFHNIRHYHDKQYFEENRYIRLISPHEETLWEVFAFYSTHIDFNYIEVRFPSDAHFMALIDEIRSKSVHDSDIEFGADDQMLTLSTCTGASRDTRNVLHAKLISRVNVEDMGDIN